MYKLSSIPTYHFLANKYGKELLIDIGRIEKIKNFNLTVAPHQLSFYEILFIDRGVGYFVLDDHRIALQPGLVIFTSPGHIRQWLISEAVGGYAVYFEKDFLNLFFTDELFLYRFGFFHQYQKPAYMIAGPAEAKQYGQINEQIAKEFSHLQNDSAHLLRALLYQLLVMLHRSYASAHGWQPNTSVHPVFHRFRSLLETTYEAHRRVLDYVHALHTSPAHLNKLCRQYMGITAQQMIHYKQLSEAKRRLRSSSDSVASIAYQLHFSDPSNFNRFFRSLTGITPQQYRQQF